MISILNPLPPVSVADAVTGIVTTETVSDAANVSSAANPASIVELSAQALLAAAAEVTLENEILNAQAFEQYEEQLTAAAIAAEATGTQNIEAAQMTALTEAEASVIDQALQSTIADAALNEAIAATAIATANPAPETTIANSTPAAAVATPAATPAPTPTPAAAAPVAAPVTTPVVAQEEEEIFAEAVIASTTVNPATPITDPSVAAAIAAYRVNDSILAEGEPLAEQAPPESDIDVKPTARIDNSKVDLHDSARDEALHGVTWNWRRVDPIQRRLGKR